RRLWASPSSGSRFTPLNLGEAGPNAPEVLPRAGCGRGGSDLVAGVGGDDAWSEMGANLLNKSKPLFKWVVSLDWGQVLKKRVSSFAWLSVSVSECGFQADCETLGKHLTSLDKSCTPWF
ncbi:hypothetical protein H1C71_033076, partial [Ictidomys tridecemlineatus]